MLYATQARSAHEAIRRVRVILDDHATAAPDLATQLLTLDSQCLIELGNFEQALQATAIAHAIGDDDAVAAEVRVACLLARGHALSRLRRYQGARQVLDDAASRAEHLHDDSLRAQSLLLMADTWRHEVFARYVALTEEAYDVFSSAGDREGAGECARILAYLSSPSSAVRYERWAQIARAATTDDDVRAQAWLARGAQIALGARLDFRGAATEARKAIEYGRRAGAKDAVIDGYYNLIQAHVGLGEPDAAVATASELIELANAEGNPRTRLVAGAISAPAFLRAGQTARAREELALARAGLDGFGLTESAEVSIGESLTSRDVGRWRESLDGLVASEEAAQDSGFTLVALVARADQVRARLMSPAPPSIAELSSLKSDCGDVGAALVASYVDALADQAGVLEGLTGTLSVPEEGACLEELAIRADTAALRGELVGEDPAPLWQHARGLWHKLGYTIWLARAQAKTGDVTAAEHTLDVLESPADARAWALGQDFAG
jgi:tetratricopeptide (TPR) repeat protein